MKNAPKNLPEQNDHTKEQGSTFSETSSSTSYHAASKPTTLPCDQQSHGALKPTNHYKM
jgi:hypothetical protein